MLVLTSTGNEPAFEVIGDALLKQRPKMRIGEYTGRSRPIQPDKRIQYDTSIFKEARWSIVLVGKMEQEGSCC